MTQLLTKKLSIIALLLATVFASFPSMQVNAACNAKVIASTKKSNNCDFTKGKLDYSINKDNCTVTVTGLNDSYKNCNSVTIPNTIKCNGKKYKVTKVSNNAFSNCTNLTKVSCSKKIANKLCNKLGTKTIKICK